MICWIISVNYIQALPGTPVYELARDTGLIGKSLEEEEDLNKVSIEAKSTQIVYIIIKIYYTYLLYVSKYNKS